MIIGNSLMCANLAVACRISGWSGIDISAKGRSANQSGEKERLPTYATGTGRADVKLRSLFSKDRRHARCVNAECASRMYCSIVTK